MAASTEYIQTEHPDVVPCPFCHQPPLFVRRIYQFGKSKEMPAEDMANLDHVNPMQAKTGERWYLIYKYAFRVMCGNPDCPGSHHMVSGTTKDKVAEHWNARASETLSLLTAQ